jgi:outer membrane receptor protein involved in Fe transport
VANISFIAGDDCKIDEALRLSWADPAAFPAGVPNGGVQFEETDQAFGSLDLNYRLSEALTLNSVTGYYDNSFATAHSGSTTGTTVPFMNVIDFDNRQFTQELRLTSDYSDSPVNFMVGAFYMDGDQRNEVRIPFNVSLGFPLPALLVHVIHDVEITSASIFGQVLWDIAPELELAAGARYTDEEREHAQNNRNPGQGAVGPTTLRKPKISSSNVSPEVTLTYKPTENLTAFAAYKTGFKSGSFTSQTFVPPTTDASFQDEEAKGGEVGLKARMADGRLTANIAAYYYDYTDLQVGALELTQVPGGQFVFAVRTLNAASATVKGIDFDVNYSPAAIDGLTLTGALNYNRARYDSFPNAPCGNGQTIALGCDQLFNPTTQRYLAQDLSGRRLVRAPDLAGFLGFNHAMTFGNEMTLNIGAGASYMDEYSTTLVDLPGFEQDSFVKFDANVALSGRDNAWEVALIGRNLDNELTRGWCVNSNVQNGTVFGGQVYGAATGGPAGQDEAVCMIERGREVWARLSFRF